MRFHLGGACIDVPLDLQRATVYEQSPFHFFTGLAPEAESIIPLVPCTLQDQFTLVHQDDH